ncbi:hypothetical protein Tco_0941694 [Tanacetum coccineum]|uniref:Retrotransposon gag domain-containing protein n=1 Tax=Tanacetum coccineum TaxID=301880 RepID=A0ABQ5DYC1_9ASTR
MAIFVVSISSNSSEESVGTSTARVILFGMIPTTIPATVPIVDPPVVHDDTPLIPTETPTISPVVSTLPYTSLFLYTDSSDSDTFERPPSQDPYELTLARSKSRVAARSSPPSPPTLRQILPAPPGLPRRPAILVLPGQPFPVGRPYRTQPNRVHDFSSDTSLGSSSGYSSNHSSGHSIPDSSFDSPAASIARPSHKRLRSPIISVPLATPLPGALSPVRVDLLPSRKRIRDIDTDITAAEAAVAREADTRVEVDIRINREDEVKEEVKSSHRGTIKIGVDTVVEPVVSEDTHVPTDDEDSRERDQGHRITIPTAIRTGMTPVTIEEMIERRVAKALEAYRNHKPTRENVDEHGDDNGNGNKNSNGNGLGGGNRNINPNVNVGGVVPATHECTYQYFLKCQPLIFKGNEGVVGLTRWFEKMEMVFHISNCPPKYQVKYASCTLQNGALTWNEIQKMETELCNLTVRNNDMIAYTQRFKELVLLCTKMVPEEEDRVEKFIGENKRRFENNSRDSRVQQPPFKRQNSNGQNVA